MSPLTLFLSFLYTSLCYLCYFCPIPSASSPSPSLPLSLFFSSPFFKHKPLLTCLKSSSLPFALTQIFVLLLSYILLHYTLPSLPNSSLTISIQPYLQVPLLLFQTSLAVDHLPSIWHPRSVLKERGKKSPIRTPNPCLITVATPPLLLFKGIPIEL